MLQPKLEVPAELRDLTEKAIDQAEQAFRMFFDAASKSIAAAPGPTATISKQALSFTEQNMKAAFEHARKLVQATDFQQAYTIAKSIIDNKTTYNLDLLPFFPVIWLSILSLPVLQICPCLSSLL